MFADPKVGGGRGQGCFREEGWKVHPQDQPVEAGLLPLTSILHTSTPGWLQGDMKKERKKELRPWATVQGGKYLMGIVADSLSVVWADVRRASRPTPVLHLKARRPCISPPRHSPRFVKYPIPPPLPDLHDYDKFGPLTDCPSSASPTSGQASLNPTFTTVQTFSHFPTPPHALQDYDKIEPSDHKPHQPQARHLSTQQAPQFTFSTLPPLSACPA